METKFESRVGKIAYNEVVIYEFISDFNNLKQFIPADKVNDFESDSDSCRFSVPNMGKVGLHIVDRQPTHMVKVAGEGMGNQQFFLWVQLKAVANNDTRVKLTIKADMNPMVNMMASKYIQGFLDKLVDAFEQIKVA